MPLRVKAIKLNNFRSYESFSLEEIGMLTVFVGPNAIGKTNVVEAIQLLTSLNSFRGSTVDQLVRKGEDSSLISMAVSDGNRELDVRLYLEGHSKKYRLNGKAKRSSDLKGLVPSVTFTPDDLDLVKGSMSVRRHTLDALGSQLNANYHLIRKDYDKVIRHKNKLLKEEASSLLIDSIDEMLVTCGAQLLCYRLALFARLIPHMKSLYEDIAQHKDVFSASYEYSWVNDVPCEEDGEAKLDLSFEEESSEILPFVGDQAALTRDEARLLLQDALRKKRDQERLRKRCLVGPHLDRIHFFVNDLDAAHYASQGQQRSIVLAERLAEAAVIEDMLGQKPILLLDDVMSELDGARREALVSYISKDVQTFVTTANIAYFDEDMLERADVVYLKRDADGKVEPVRADQTSFEAEGMAGDHSRKGEGI